MSGFDPDVYAFEGYELDASRFELRRYGARVHAEPQVISLLILLVRNRHRMVSKDEIVEKIWDGRIVSESAIAARIMAARKAIGDDGTRQRLIRTIHGKGFRFVGEATGTDADEKLPATAPSAPAQLLPAHEQAEPTGHRPQGRASIAVLPFALVGEAGPHAIVADALPADIIMDLSRLHWLFVIARGSSFRFRGVDIDPRVVGRELAVRYCLTGTIERTGRTVAVRVALIDTGDGGTIWAERYDGDFEELQALRPDIEADVVASLAVRIPQNEVRRARNRPPAELDAWASYHLGLDHAYRFTKDDNARAAALFDLSLQRDPHFSGALGGLSFTHFQNAFLRFAHAPDAELDMARRFAHRAVDADRLDPFAHFNVGRCSWLEGQLEDAADWFDRATSLSPNFAQGIYNRGLVATMAGNAEAADRDLTLALELSPLDPLAYAMISSRALVHLQRDDFAAAAELGARAAMMPGAHKHIDLIAALTAHLAGRSGDARSWLARARTADPELSAATFFGAFPFAQVRARETIERGLAELGL